MLNPTILRPGILVSLRTSIRGNVSYKTFDLGTELVDGVEVTKWDTERTTRDKEEQERAVKARSKARSILSSVCVHSDFGLLCLQSRRAELDAAIAEARKVANEFNLSAQVSRLSVNIVTGEIAPNDQLAIRGIKTELRELIEDMQEGMKNLDVKKIREAADKARMVGQMLTPDAQAQVQEAIDLARKTAREIKRAGESAAIEVDRAAIAKVAQARTAFLDLDDQGEIGTVESTGRAVDFEPAPVEMKAAPAQSSMFDM